MPFLPRFGLIAYEMAVLVKRVGQHMVANPRFPAQHTASDIGLPLGVVRVLLDDVAYEDLVEVKTSVCCDSTREYLARRRAEEGSDA
ncbi:MAG: hypothetical protein ACRDOE_15810 [Streptosporangiaceae bacterium]